MDWDQLSQSAGSNMQQIRWQLVLLQRTQIREEFRREAHQGRKLRDRISNEG
jgi:hypothetical protein